MRKTKSGQAVDDLYISTWPFWKKLQFLQNVMEVNKSIDTSSQQSPHQSPISPERSFETDDSLNSTEIDFPSFKRKSKSGKRIV